MVQNYFTGHKDLRLEKRWEDTETEVTACWSQNRDQEFESLIKHPPYVLWTDERPRPWKAEETTRQLKQNEWINEWMKSNFWFCRSLYYLFCFIMCSSCLHCFLPLLLGFILFFSNLFELTFGLLIFTFFKVFISNSILHNLIPWVLMSFSSTQFFITFSSFLFIIYCSMQIFLVLPFFKKACYTSFNK